jgi:hypothetical protein
MKCEQCDSHLSAYIDDELTAALATDVQQHLQGCQTCQKTLADLRVVDARLQRLRLPQSGIARIVAASRPKHSTSLASTPQRSWPSRLFPWSVVAIVAACITLVIVLMPEAQTPTPTPIAGRLVRATGSVEVLPPGSDQWQRIEASQEAVMQNGARVRTFPSVSCEIETTENARLRLDQTAELILHAPDRVEVVVGQVWSRASDSKSLRVDTSAPDAGKHEPFSMTCPSDSEFLWNVAEDQAVCSSLSGGETDWAIPQFRCPVGPGERVAVDSEHNVQRSRQDAWATKIWQLPLLAMDQAVDRELEEIVESMLIKIGSTKAGYLHESQIRRLGPAGAIPLLAYVQSASSHNKISIRHSAMRIATELADKSGVIRLRQLCGDEDASIAELAKAALQRIE